MDFKNRFLGKLNTSAEWNDDWNGKNTQIAIDIIALGVFYQGEFKVSGTFASIITLVSTDS